MEKRILVVDDDQLVLNSLKKLFEKEGYFVETALSGKEALEKIESKAFDLIIIDIRMPELDGIETTKRIKQILKSKARLDIPVLFITGFSDLAKTAEAENLGEVILKPFDLEEFLEKVKQTTTKRRVVITGLGVVSSIGIGIEEFWEANLKGLSGVELIRDFDTSNYDCKISAPVKNFEPTKFMSELLTKKTDRFTQFALACTKMALEETNLDLERENLD
ncbi:MAG: response regulator, partial [Candidatus Omnitrophica bacterium]|nr:response regulator [Candidatus Omnitrophota bacterium]